MGESFRKIEVGPEGDAEIKKMSEEEKKRLNDYRESKQKQKGKRGLLSLDKEGNPVVKDSSGNIIQEVEQKEQ